MSETGKRRSKWIVPAILIVIAVVALAIYVIFTTPGIIKPKDVTLAGTVTTTGAGTNPEKITFTSMRDSKTYVAAVSGGGNPGTYCIILPNADSYNVTISWRSYGIFSGDANAGTLNLDTFEKSIERNWAG